MISKILFVKPLIHRRYTNGEPLIHRRDRNGEPHAKLRMLCGGTFAASEILPALNFGSSRPLKNFLLNLAVIAFRLLGVSTVHC